MFNLSENYYLRQCFLREDQVPTQSMMKKKMSPPLAAVYFKSMTPKLKKIAGLEPSLKGGGNDWYVPPEELLEGRAVLKPVKKEVLAKLKHQGIESIGTKLYLEHVKALDLELKNALLESDIKWRNTIVETCNHDMEVLGREAAKKNTQHIVNDFKTFAHLYRQSLGKIEALIHEAVIADIAKARKDALQEMQDKYTTLLKYQATELYETYDKKLQNEKAKLKAEFLQEVDRCHTEMADQIHDINVDKHGAIEQLRVFLEHRNLACQIYVALKEREMCLQETDELKRKHDKKVKFLSGTIAGQKIDIHQKIQKEKKRQEFYKCWQKKVCQVVKYFQTFVSYCLKMFPDHAEFFINMEKLMLLQVNEALEMPAAESIIKVEKEQFHTPVPLPKPFYLFCDKGYKAKVDQELCPKHSGTSSRAAHLPAIIINKRYLYSACDNFEQYTNKIKAYIHGNRGDDADFRDDLVYENFVPVKYTSSEQLSELKLESSLLRVLRQELAYLETDYTEGVMRYSYCKLPFCMCTNTPRESLPRTLPKIGSSTLSPKTSQQHSIRFPPTDKNMVLRHQREPKWGSYFNYVKPKKCSCAKTAKKHLEEHLPVYMHHIPYAEPVIPGYDMCSFSTLKALVKEARNELPPISPVKVKSKTKNASTQFKDLEFEKLCTCLGDDELSSFLNKNNVDLTVFTSPGMGDDDVPPTSFATARAHSLRNLLEDLPELKMLFSRKDCTF